MNSRKSYALLRVLSTLCAFAIGTNTSAQTIRFDQKYIERLDRASDVAALSDDIFGESISLKDGQTTFTSVDIDIPGNNELPVQLIREIKVEDRGLTQNSHLGGFGVAGDIALPHMRGVFTTAGWQVAGASPNARCSAPAPPPALSNGITASDYWSGNTLNVPGHGEQVVLYDIDPAIPGSGYTMLTKNLWKISCLNATANGYPGEGFVATSPAGISYRFDYVVSKPYPSLSKRVGNYSASAVTSRSIVYFLVSKIEDRHGNSVSYTYSGDRLASISSSDGRSISVSAYSNGRYTRFNSSVGTWNYHYTSNSARVVRPDSSEWRYETSGALQVEPTPNLPLYMGQPRCPAPERSSGQFGLIVTHPSGARGVFDFKVQRHFRHNIPKLCSSFLDMAGPSTSYQFLVIPNFNDALTIQSKTVTGPGMDRLQWTYEFGIGASGLAFEENCPGPTALSCPLSIETRVIGPDRTYDSYRFGAWYNYNDGLLLKHDSGSTDATGRASIDRSIEHEYVLPGDRDFIGFPFQIGRPGSSRLDGVSAGYILPLKESRTLQSGVTFKTRVEALDYLARPTRVRKVGTDPVASVREIATAYHDAPAAWVLGQVSSETVSGHVASKVAFNATAMPISIHSFGRLVQTLSWNGDGTVKSVGDGNGHLTLFSNWKRGVPQSVKFPATPEAPSGSTIQALVNNAGNIASVTDESGHTTSYNYDAMGRLARVTWPTGDTTSWADTTNTFEQMSAQQYGIGPGHWRRTTQTGNARRIVYYDAFWRPLLIHEFDASDVAGTQRFQRYSYDYAGRTIFSSYPSISSAASEGVWSEYDAIGRHTSVTQDSELGPLTTITEHLAGFQTRVTTPKGIQTLTRYLAWDQPSLDAPVHINQPGGLITEISRDIFGKPTRIMRRDSSASTVLARDYVYDSKQQLCKSVEPETGATVTAYDGAGNVDWTASGLALTSAVACNLSNVPTSQRVRRVYDARNRVQSLLFPDGLGSTHYDYTPTGQIAQIVVDNGGTGVATTVYTRNKRGMITGEAMGVGNVAWGLGYGYDANGNLATQVHSISGRTIDYAPNALGQATRAGPYVLGATYHPNGRLKQFIYGNGLTRFISQNSRGLVERVRDYSSAVVAIDESMSYDAHGNVLTIRDGRQGHRGDRTMEYDSSDRLFRATSPMFGVAAYSYDVLDNLRSVRISNGPRSRQFTYGYDASNRLTNVQSGAAGGGSTIGYDVRGNVSSKDGRTYLFDFGNRLREIQGGEAYRYDGNGRRVQSIRNGAGIYSIYGHDGVLRYQRDEHRALEREYIYLAGSQVAEIETPIALAPPVLSAPIDSVSGAFSISWTSVSGASRYELQELAPNSGWNNLQSGLATTVSLSGKGSGAYSYRVRACSVARCGDWSPVSTVSVQLAPSTAPSLTVPGTAPGGSYAIVWTAVPFSTRYELGERIENGTWAVVQNSSSTSRAFSGKPAATYGYRVRACNSTGCSAWSSVKSTVVVLVPTSSPTISGDVTNLTGAYTLSWSAVSSAATYELQRSANGTSWSTVQSSSSRNLSVTGQAAGSWRYKVRACNSAGCGGFSGTHTVVVTRAPTAAPVATAPTTVTANTATISWTAVQAAATYQVERRFNAGAWQSISTTEARSISSTGLVSGRYEHRVRACNAAGCGAYSGVTSTNVTLPPTQAPTVSAPAASAVRFTISWTAVSGAAHYMLENKTGPGNWSNGTRVDALNFTYLPANGVYDYRVKACNSVGCGPYSNIVTVNVFSRPPTPPCPPPGCPMPDSISNEGMDEAKTDSGEAE